MSASTRCRIRSISSFSRYPVMQKAPAETEPAASLRVCWLGRIIPRKRLDLFLTGAALAIRQGVDVRLTIIGGIGFIPGYDKLIKAFAFPGPASLGERNSQGDSACASARHDVLIQPSDEENFGSSVAEAQACGLPVIVGRTNGNADYLCSRDIHLTDDRPETLAEALSELSSRKAQGRVGGSRDLAAMRRTIFLVGESDHRTVQKSWNVRRTEYLAREESRDPPARFRLGGVRTTPIAPAPGCFEESALL